MCYQTKSSYGCGHTYKETVDCHLSSCTGLERCAVETMGSCRICRADGANVPRGRDGQSRYAKEQKHSRSRDHLDIYPTRIQPLDIPPSPWAPLQEDDPEERLWGTPTRVKADHAWLREHVERQRSISTEASPARDLVDEWEVQQRRDDQEARLRREIEKSQRAERRLERRREERRHSHEDLDVVPIVDRRSSHSHHHRRTPPPYYSLPTSPTHPCPHSFPAPSQYAGYGGYDTAFGPPPTCAFTQVIEFNFHQPCPVFVSNYGMGHAMGNVIGHTGSTWNGW